MLGHGFLALDLRQIQRRIEQQPWVASARVTRRWPGTLKVTIVEQQPAARWGEQGLLNARGELFIEQAARVPAELPRLDGPEGSETRVVRRFIALREEMTPRGVTLVALQLDERGAWSFQLSNGIEVRLGSVATEDRLGQFYRAWDEVLGAIAEEVNYVDMRYANGFAVGWKDPDRKAVAVRTGVGIDV